MVVIKNFCGVFRTKIDEGIYSFDIIVVCKSNLYSSFVGCCVVNTRRDIFSVTISEAITLSKEEKREIGRSILKEAKNIEKVLKP